MNEVGLALVLGFRTRCCVIGPLDLFCGTVTSSPRVLTKFPLDFLSALAAGTKNGPRFKWSGNILWDEGGKYSTPFLFHNFPYVDSIGWAFGSTMFLRFRWSFILSRIYSLFSKHLPATLSTLSFCAQKRASDSQIAGD